MLLLLLFIGTAVAAPLGNGTNNAYGDELIIPEKKPHTRNDPVLEDKPLSEEATVQLLQDGTEKSPAVVSSGYRKRRNSYGDELVTPAPGAGAQGYDEVEENTAPTVGQPLGSTEPVEASGY